MNQTLESLEFSKFLVGTKFNVVLQNPLKQKRTITIVLCKDKSGKMFLRVWGRKMRGKKFDKFPEKIKVKDCLKLFGNHHTYEEILSIWPRMSEKPKEEKTF